MTDYSSSGTASGLDENASLAEWLAVLPRLPRTPTQAGALDLNALRRSVPPALLKTCAPVITVAGTNGKGSCIAVLEAVFQAAGLRAGVYTSPHFFAYTERIRIAGQDVSEAQLCQAFFEVSQTCLPATLSLFEVLTLAALFLFRRAHVDVLLLEVGLGGRLDAVNLLDADVAVITTVALDHTAYLGSTREAIGYEKAGIFRSGKPAVYGEVSLPNSVRQHAQKIGTPLYCLGKDFGYQRHSRQTWSWRAGAIQHPLLPCPRLALDNAATALMAITQLQAALSHKTAPRTASEHALTRPFNTQTLSSGLSSVDLPGRAECNTHPTRIPRTYFFDVAHNPAACRRLAQQLKQELNSDEANDSNKKTLCSSACQITAVVGILPDKDIEAMLQALRHWVSLWYIAPLLAQEGHSPCVIETTLQGWGETYHRCASVSQAMEQAALELKRRNKSTLSLEASPNDCLLVFGSFRTVAQAKIYLKEKTSVQFSALP